MRDDEGSDTTRRHLERCHPCRGELDRLYQMQARLKALPAFSPPRDRWPQVRDAVLTERRERRRHSTTRIAFALAATMLLVVVAKEALDYRQERRASRALLADLVDLRERSQLLEAELRAVEQRPRVLSGWRAETIVRLEDRIGELDRQLRASGRVVGGSDRRAGPIDSDLELWRERIELQGALFQLRLAPVSSRGV